MALTFFRTYQRTHPWISFRADFTRAPHTLWLLLGEARSKCEHVAGVPLQPEISQALYQMYFIKGVHATAAIEGNSLSEEQIGKHLEGSLELPASKEYQAREVDNLVKAVNDLLETIHREGPSREISPELIKGFNAAILNGLTLDADTVPGEVRKHSVGVADYRGAPAEDCEFLLERLCEWLNEEKFDNDQDFGTAGALLKAIISHIYLAWIHPFGDGNGRTARLLEFYILVNAGIPVPSAHLLSDHYNTTRADYYRFLSHASKSNGDIMPFVRYAIRGFVDELREQLAYIRAQQWGISWKDYVNEYFEHLGSSETIARRKCLLLDLSREDKPVPRNRLALLSPRVATYYAKKTDKTLSRDLNALLAANLITRTRGGYQARRDIILAFLPPTWKAEQ